MEAIVRPLSWGDWPDQSRNAFKALRSEGGEKMVLEKNFFVEKLLPHAILRTLDEAEMAEYRRPFLELGERRRPTLTWPREIPIDGEPADVVKIVGDYADWFAKGDVPKLFDADPVPYLSANSGSFAALGPIKRLSPSKAITSYKKIRQR